MSVAAPTCSTLVGLVGFVGLVVLVWLFSAWWCWSTWSCGLVLSRWFVWSRWSAWSCWSVWACWSGGLVSFGLACWLLDRWPLLLPPPFAPGSTLRAARIPTQRAARLQRGSGGRKYSAGQTLRNSFGFQNFRQTLRNEKRKTVNSTLRNVSADQHLETFFRLYGDSDAYCQPSNT